MDAPVLMQPSAVQSPREKCRWVRLFSTVKERNGKNVEQKI